MKRSGKVAGAVVALWVVASNFNAGAADVTTAQSDAAPAPPRKVTPAGDIILTNKAMSFFDLQGRGYTNVDFVKVNLDGLVWRDKEAMGQVSLTNLDLGFLAGLGVYDDRIAGALARAQKRAGYVPAPYAAPPPTAPLSPQEEQAAIAARNALRPSDTATRFFDSVLGPKR